MTFILYGSQTGQAKSIAENLYNVLSSKNDKIKICELDQLNKSYILNKINRAIIICSTTGDGDAPENAEKFVRKIKSVDPNSLTNLQYTVLGLGDTNYSNFCNCGKTIDSILSLKGAKRFYISKWADDATGLELVVEPWIEGLCKIVSNFCDIEVEMLTEKLAICDIIEESIPKSLLSESVLLGDKEAIDISDTDLSLPIMPANFIQLDFDTDITIPQHKLLISSAALPADKSGIILATVKEISKLTEKYAIKTVHKITLDTGESPLSWSPGDSIGVLPSNSSVEVDSLLTRLNIPINLRDCAVSISVNAGTAKRNAAVPEHLRLADGERLSLRTALMWLMDLRAPLSKAGLRAMAACCPAGGGEQRRLLQLCSKEGQMLYISCIREPCLPVLDLLNWFPSCTLPIERLLEFLPRLKPRAYSLCDLDQVQFAFSKVDIGPVPAFRRRPLTGVCTTWMESLSRSEVPMTVPIYLRKNLNGFTVTHPEQPHILIGPGTGVAPFIGFLQHFERLKEAGVKVGPVWLFFGCRSEQKDFLFRGPLSHFLERKVLAHLCVCFSRDAPLATGSLGDVCVPPGCKYVQDCLLRHAADLAPLVAAGARVMVCGDASGLARDLLATWPKVLLAGAHPGVASERDAVAMVARMRIDRVYLEDVWL